MTVKVKEGEIGLDELEAVVAGLRMLAAAPEEAWSQYVTRQDHLEDLVIILKKLDVTPSYAIRCVGSNET